MLARVVSFVLAVVLLGSARPALACMNAVMATNEAVAQLHDAEQALDAGDVVRARDLALDVMHATARHQYDPEAPQAPLHGRAVRLRALATVRDPSATPEDIELATSMLESHLVATVGEADANAPLAVSSPALRADLGEALERGGRDVDAVARLAPLADRDLVGSAYAYAAYARALGRTGASARTAATAMERCAAMAPNADVCLGHYPSPPLLRGSPYGYGGAGVIFALVLLVRRTRPRPWRACADRTLAGAVVAGGAAAFFAARTSSLGPVLVALVAAMFLFALQRRIFFEAVRAGKEERYALRAAEPIDDVLPSISLLGWPRPETLERVADAAYRESARAPVYRLLAPRRVNRVAVGVMVPLALLVLIVALTMVVGLRGG